jgi:HPt (histidine-containing phosphotransfer) domain-containing protein
VLDRSALDRLHRIGGRALLTKMATMFLGNGAERVAVICAAAEAGDAGAVERAAHSFKSSAGNLGAVRLQRTSELLEQRAAAGEIDSAGVAQLSLDFDETAAALRHTLEEPEP